MKINLNRCGLEDRTNQMPGDSSALKCYCESLRDILESIDYNNIDRNTAITLLSKISQIYPIISSKVDGDVSEDVLTLSDRLLAEALMVSNRYEEIAEHMDMPFDSKIEVDAIADAM